MVSMTTKSIEGGAVPSGDLDPHDSLGFHCALTFRAFTAALERRLEGSRVSPTQFIALAHLIALGPMAQAELAGHLSITAASAVRLVDRMERDGWVARRPDRVDRRVKRVVPTAEARRMWRRISRHGRAVLEEAYAGIDRREITRAMRLLERVRANLKAGARGGAV